jgi:hypothetical protein
MQREDYLLRMIADTGRILAHVRRLLFQGRSSDAHAELERAARQGGIDLGLVINLDEASLRPLLLSGGEFDRPKCAFFAELAYLEWRRRLVAESPERADSVARRALLLYALAYEGIVMDDATVQHIAELQGRSAPGDLGDGTVDLPR